MGKRKSGEVSSRKIRATSHIVYAHDTLRLLRLYRDSELTQSGYADYLKWTRYKVRYHTTKLLNDNMIERIKRTQFYQATLTGVNFLDEYEKSHQKLRTSIENARWITTIRNDKHLQKFIFENGLKHHSMKHWDQWVGKLNGFTIWINIAIKTTMIIGHPTIYGGNPLHEYKEAENRVAVIVSNLDKKWNFNLTPQSPLDTMQFTTPDPIASQLMKKSAGSQIKVGKTVSFDQSYGTEPRSEFSTLSEAMMWTNMPKMIYKHEENWEQLKENFVALSEHVTKLTDIITGVTKKDEIPIKDLNPDSSKMFG